MATVVNLSRGTSTNLDPRYLYSQFVPTITITEHGRQINVLEIFSKFVVRGNNALRRIGYEQYIAQQITTIAYRRFHNTTTWWMILLLSQQLHPLLIESGYYLSMPDIIALANSLKQSSKGGVRIPRYTTI